VPSWTEIRAHGVVYEDEAILALDKPAGISVMGERHDLDLVRLAAAAGEELFPVHRIDKATSGLVLFARELRFHGDLTRQFQRRTVDKSYLVLTRTRGLPAEGTIDLPLSVGRKSRVRVAANRADIVAHLLTAGASADLVATTSADLLTAGASADLLTAGASADLVTVGAAPAGARPAGAPAAATVGRWSIPAGAVFDHVRTYPSVTTFVRLWEGGDFTLLSATPVSGRRHQIRVHLAWIGHPIEGDPLFDRAAASRTLLHSWRLAIDSGGARRRLAAEPGDDFWAPVQDLIPPKLPATLPTVLRWEQPPSAPPSGDAPSSGATSPARARSSGRRGGGARSRG
jgi:tRNA pseudouridine32 synthase/23S rRNA pseudouridine746 synthase